MTPRSVHHFFLASSHFCDSCPGRFSASSVCNQFPGVQLWCSANLFRAEFENSKLRIEGRMRIRNCSSMQQGACSHSLCQALWIYKIVKILNSNKICRALSSILIFQCYCFQILPNELNIEYSNMLVSACSVTAVHMHNLRTLPPPASPSASLSQVKLVLIFCPGPTLSYWQHFLQMSARHSAHILVQYYI